jgi:cytoskeletal protein CcmA (bactofilin family)
MPEIKQDKVLVTCPHCGNTQPEARRAISTVCKKCRQHFVLGDTHKPSVKPVERQSPGERKRVVCFECGAELDVPISAESTMCKRCSRHVDLRDYRITNAVSKNFKTKGSFVVETKGYVFNTEAIVGEATIRGRFHGKLSAEQSLTIYSTAEIKGSFKTVSLIVPAENHFRWNEPIKVKSAEIAGELVADLNAENTVTLKSTARMFGNITAGGLVVEEGAVIVGKLNIASTGP